MAGGIYVDQPFHPNPKCLFFSFVIMAIYWFSPINKSALMLLVIFVLSYVAMAWYDYQYNCDTIMKSGSAIGVNTIDSIFKPQRRDGVGGENAALDQEAEYLKRVYLFHVLVVAPLLLYVGYKGPNAQSNMYPVLFVVGLVALVYHGYRLTTNRSTQ